MVPDGQVVRLDFYTFDTESDYDYVRVYDGCTTGDPRFGSYSGDGAPSVLSTGNVLHITFTSGRGGTRQGFSATASGVDLAGNDNITDILQTVADITL